MTPKQRQALDRRKENEQAIKTLCAHATNAPGIYIMKRYEGDFKYAYVGQAKRLLERLAAHLDGYQHIDLSIKKHGLYEQYVKPHGWTIEVIECEVSQLDNMEQSWVKALANDGYQMRNKTSGRQGEGKEQIADYKPAKGYYDGLAQGYENARRKVAKWAKHLEITPKRKGNTTAHYKRASDALDNLNQFLGGSNE